MVSSDPERSEKAAIGMGIDPSRAYSDANVKLDTESDREDGAEVVAIMTPNDSHHRYALAALDRGFDVVCDKPMTNTLDEALDIVRKVDATGLVFCLTHIYTGYPMVRQARALVEDGQVGEIRLVQVEYVQGNKADESDPDPAGGLPWRYNPVRGGPSLVMGDIGTHAHNLVRFVSRLEVAEVAAEIGHVIPERPVDDYGAAMLRFDNGARGSFWVTQTAAGVENGLHIRVSGTKGSLEWHQERPTRLTFKPIDGPVREYTPNGPGALPASPALSGSAAEAYASGHVHPKADPLERALHDARRDWPGGGTHPPSARRDGEVRPRAGVGSRALAGRLRMAADSVRSNRPLRAPGRAHWTAWLRRIRHGGGGRGFDRWHADDRGRRPAAGHRAGCPAAARTEWTLFHGFVPQVRGGPDPGRVHRPAAVGNRHAARGHSSVDRLLGPDLAGAGRGGCGTGGPFPRAGPAADRPDISGCPGWRWPPGLGVCPMAGPWGHGRDGPSHLNGDW
ncbi:MAG: Gfo/Idh/MocA family oxidoreductase [Chloroflexi bacterium]|nr:Gfo/Idh/MocA family oxidoreductase [Chloroflexota bacterium]